MSPRKRRKVIQRKGELTFDEEGELLWGGTGRPGSVFASIFLKRAAWILNSDALMEDHFAGHRPVGWWQFEAKFQPRRGGLHMVRKPYCSADIWTYAIEESESDCLRRMGELAPWEEAELVARKTLRTDYREGA